MLALAIRRNGKFPLLLRSISVLLRMAFINGIFLLPTSNVVDQTEWMTEMLLGLEPCEIIALKFLKLIFIV